MRVRKLARCRTCGKPATEEIVNDVGAVYGAYCTRHATRTLRELEVSAVGPSAEWAPPWSPPESETVVTIARRRRLLAHLANRHAWPEADPMMDSWSLDAIRGVHHVLHDQAGFCGHEENDV